MSPDVNNILKAYVGDKLNINSLHFGKGISIDRVGIVENPDGYPQGSALLIYSTRFGITSEDHCEGVDTKIELSQFTLFPINGGFTHPYVLTEIDPRHGIPRYYFSDTFDSSSGTFCYNFIPADDQPLRMVDHNGNLWEVKDTKVSVINYSSDSIGTLDDPTRAHFEILFFGQYDGSHKLCKNILPKEF